MITEKLGSTHNKQRLHQLSVGFPSKVKFSNGHKCNLMCNLTYFEGTFTFSKNNQTSPFRNPINSLPVLQNYLSLSYLRKLQDKLQNHFIKLQINC